MIIAIDYDDTITRDLTLWRMIIELFKSRGHQVYCVTWRHERELHEIIRDLNDILPVDYIIPTGRKAKDIFCRNMDIFVDVWIDDNPRSVIENMMIYDQKGTDDDL